MTQHDGTSAQLEHYVQVNGLNMYYEDYGSGQPLLLLHGGLATSQMWHPHLATLTAHFRVITPDSRGHGRTDNPTGEFSYSLMADDIAAFIKALNLTRPLVLGYSDGGQIALELGMRYPTLTGALIAGAAGYNSGDNHTFLNFMGIEGPGVVNTEQFRKENPGWVEFLKMEHARADNADYWQTLLEQISTMWWTPLDYTAADLQKITESVLVFVGDRDEGVPAEQAVEIYQLIPNAELAVLPNATHFSAVDELSSSVVLDFLLRHKDAAECHPNGDAG